jgi:hypothetical protein
MQGRLYGLIGEREEPEFGHQLLLAQAMAQFAGRQGARYGVHGEIGNAFVIDCKQIVFIFLPR